MTNNLEHLTICLLAIWISSLMKCLLSLLFIHKLWCVFFLLIHKNSLHILRYESFCRYTCCEYFSQSAVCLFILLTMSFDEWKFLSGIHGTNLFP